MIVTAPPEPSGSIDWTSILEATAPVVGAVFVVVGGWFLTKGREARKLAIEDRKIWAEQATQLTRMYIEGWQHVAEVSGQAVQILSPVKAFREILRTLEEYAQTGTWSPRLEEQGILTVTTVIPRKEEHMKSRVEVAAWTIKEGVGTIWINCEANTVSPGTLPALADGDLRLHLSPGTTMAQAEGLARLLNEAARVVTLG